MPKCSFCSQELSLGTGKMLVKNDGKISYFCCKKCEKNSDLKRSPAEVGWIRKKQPGAAKLAKK